MSLLLLFSGAAGTSGTVALTITPSATAGQGGPTFHAAGAGTGQLGNLVLSLPTGHQLNDILLACTENAPADPALAAPAGWTEVTNSPQTAVGGTADLNVRLQVFWKRDNGAEPATVTFLDTGDHQAGIVLGFRGCRTVGDPWNVTAGSSNGTPGTALTFPSVTTTVASTLIVNVVGLPNNDSTTNTLFSGFTNANLASITEVADFSDSSGDGGGIGAAVGTKLAAGSTGTTTATSSISRRFAYLTIALMAGSDAVGTVPLTITPAASGTLATTATAALAIVPAGNLIGQAPIVGTVALAVTPSAASRLSTPGTIPLAFTPSATATIDVTSGTIPLAITPAGNLTGVGALVGTVPMVFTPSSPGATPGIMVGTTALAFTLSATITVSTSITAAMVITPLATLTGTARSPGNVAMAFTPAALAAANAAIQGTIPLAFTVIQTLSPVGDLYGSIRRQQQVVASPSIKARKVFH